MVVDNTAVILF